MVYCILQMRMLGTESRFSFVQLHVNKYAPTRAGFISYDCVVVYIINNVCSFEWNE